MSIWDLSDERTWDELAHRAAYDAWTAVSDAWPERGEGEINLPDDVVEWAKNLTLDFLAGSVGLPRWSMNDPQYMRGAYLSVRNYYYRICLENLYKAIDSRMRKTHRVPRNTTPLFMQGQHQQALAAFERDEYEESDPHHRRR